MPRLNVDSEAFGDWRFERLGQLAGIDTFSAFGRSMHVWQFGLTQLRDVLSIDEIEGVSRLPGFASHMEAAQLAERKPEGYRIRGLGHRMAWLGALRESSRAGGEANRKRIESRKASQRDSQKDSPLSLALALALAPSLESKERSIPVASLPSPPEASTEPFHGEPSKPKRKPKEYFDSTVPVIQGDEYDRLRDLHDDLTDKEFNSILERSEEIFVGTKKKRTRHGVINWAAHFLKNEKAAVKARRPAKTANRSGQNQFTGFSREEATEFLSEVDRREADEEIGKAD